MVEINSNNAYMEVAIIVNKKSINSAASLTDTVLILKIRNHTCKK